MHFCTGGDTANPTVCTETCGHGVITTSEECDDGATIALDGCDSTCQFEDGWDWNTGSPIPICGDGKVVQGEVCDDGDNTDGRGCAADCSGDELGWTCSGGDLTTADSCVSTCGDYVIVLGE